MRISPRLRLGVAIGLAVPALVLLIYTGFWAWLLRDGLGPDAVESSGVEALRRFVLHIWPFAALCIGLLVVAFWIARTGKARAADGQRRG